MQKQPFTELLIWQKGIDLIDCIYQISEKYPTQEIYNLTSQSRRAAVSVPTNIAEGSQRTTVKDFANYILIAKGSLAELYTLMYIAKRRNFISDKDSNVALGKIDELSRMMFSFYKKLTTAHS